MRRLKMLRHTSYLVVTTPTYGKLAATIPRDRRFQLSRYGLTYSYSAGPDCSLDYGNSAVWGPESRRKRIKARRKRLSQQWEEITLQALLAVRDRITPEIFNKALKYAFEVP